MNLKVTANLGSPLCGDPPLLDSLLTYILSFKMKKVSGKKFLRSTPLSEFENIPIPINYFMIQNLKIYRCSNPIYKIYTEWHDRHQYRFETDKLSLLIKSDKRRVLSIGGGVYKSRFAPIHVKLIDKIIWFVNGNFEECQRLLKDVNFIGYYRKIGYGFISSWEIEKIEDDLSVYAKGNNIKILMRTLPIEKQNEYTGFKIGYGAVNPPYWHPKNQREIIIPC
jgi:hypothetical protein